MATRHLAPQTFSVWKGADENVTIQMRPAQDVTGWTLEFRARSAAVNPDMTTQSYLVVDITDSATTMKVTAPQRWPLEGFFQVRIDTEIMEVTSGPGFYSNAQMNSEWTIQRGIWGTTPAAHTAGARITIFSVPQMLLDNGSHGGVIVDEETTGAIHLEFDSDFTNDRPDGMYHWTLRRTNGGNFRPCAYGVMYLLPSPLSVDPRIETTSGDQSYNPNHNSRV